ncbi:MAG: glycoside hydrolase, partial [Treponema sp.]|nr:glycoside hydrolase [Treponema sp.]
MNMPKPAVSRGNFLPGSFRLPIFCLVFFVFSLFSGSLLYGLSEFFWEDPEIFSEFPGNFPVSAFNGRLSAIAWQEAEPGGTGGGLIRISLGIKKTGESWRIRRDIGLSYPYSGTEPALLSIAVDQEDRILIAAAGPAVQPAILLSENGGENFRAYPIEGAGGAFTPRIFPCSGGGYLLFITRWAGQSSSLYCARSEDGISWPSFEVFAEGPDPALPFLPSHAALGKTDYVLFQSPAGGDSGTDASRLFLKTSTDGGKTWSPPRLFTDFYDAPAGADLAPGPFDNRRPHLSVWEENLFVVWERRFGADPPQIYGALMGPGGRLIGRPRRINTETASCYGPAAFVYEGELTVVWFDNRRGYNHVFLAQPRGTDWQNYDLSGSAGDVSSVLALVDSEGLFVFWQSLNRGVNRIYSLVPDTAAASPRIITENFVSGRRTRGDRARISWQTPHDPSGIVGFSYLWTRDPEAVPERRIMLYDGTSHFLEQVAPEDGTWYFTLIARDFAGNWSGVSRAAYLRDTTPPPPPRIKTPPLDKGGYLLSNTFSLHWHPSPAPDVAGYTWLLQYLGPPEILSSFGAKDFPAAAEERFRDLLLPLPRIMG